LAIYIDILGIVSIIIFAMIAYRHETVLENSEKKHMVFNRAIPIVICFIISILCAVNLDSFHIIFANRINTGTDSSVFLYIGKAMYNGSIPYRDLFDHKGIILYFIEYLGCLVGFGNIGGIWFVELINMFVTTMLFYLIAKLITNSKIISYITVYIILKFCSLQFFQGDNLVEEYALPWISLSLYFVVKFFVTKEYKNRSIIAIGISFAVVFLLRVNMVGLWAALLFSVMICFIKSKEYSQLIKCGILFVLGCLIVFVPVLIYLLCTDSLKDMIEYYFVFNFQYTNSHSKLGAFTLLYSCISAAGISSIFIIYSLLVYRKEKILYVNIFALIFAFISAAIGGRTYLHYGIILIPFFVIPGVFTITSFLEKTKEVNIPCNKKVLLLLVTMMSAICVLINPVYRIFVKRTLPIKETEICEYLNSNTTEKDDVLILGNAAQYYIKVNRSTKNKFFYQNPPIDVSDDLCEEFINELENNPSDYIINFTFENLFDSERGYQKVINYLENLCKQGVYRVETNDNFEVYVKE